MSISSDEVNFLVYRYLQESGILPTSIPHMFAQSYDYNNNNTGGKHLFV